MSSGKVVFLVGNGFSQGLGFPSMKQLWERSLQSSDTRYNSSDTRYNRFLEEAKGRYPLSRFIREGEAINDLELLLTVWSVYLETYGSDVSNTESGRGHYEKYIENLCNWLRHFTLAGRDTTEFNDFKSLISELLETRRPVVFITTNYDLLVEALLLKLGRSPVFMNDANEGKSNSIPVRKLHGSISWFCSSDAMRQANPRHEMCTVFKGTLPKCFVYDVSEDWLDPSILQGTPSPTSQVHSTNVAPLGTLIPPVINKKYNELFDTVMRHAWQDLEGVDRLVIVGYSFPEADPVVCGHIVNACQKYMTRESQALFINESTEACSRAQEFLGPLVRIR